MRRDPGRRTLRLLAAFGLYACALPAPARSGERTVCEGALGMSAEKGEERVDLVVTNACHVPVAVTVEFEKLVNLRPLAPLQPSYAVSAGSSAHVVTLQLVERGSEAHYHPQLRLQYVGSLPPAPDAAFRYAFPFAGSASRLAQGVDGAYTHQGTHRYAFDFVMPIGTPVVAARDGIVLFVIDGYGEGGPDPSFEKRGNGVHVLHDDGTIASYGHLAQGIPVAEGDRVRAGEVLGASGNSGYSRGPHLHFEVSTQHAGMQLDSIPIRFRGDVLPVQGESYGPYPGGAAAAGR